MNRMRPLDWLMLLTLSVLWGGSFLCVGIAIKEFPAMTIVLIRVGLSAVFLHLILKLSGINLPRDKSIWAAFFIMGLLNNAIPFTLITYGQAYIASGLASILNATTPIFTLLIAHFFTSDEKLTRIKGFGILIGFLGVTIMIGFEVLSGLSAHIFAQVVVLLAALSYAFAGVFGRIFKQKNVPAMVVATGQVTASTVILFPFVLIFDRPWELSVPSIPAVIALLMLVLFSTVCAYLLFFKILERAGATNLLLVTFLIPPSAVLFGILILNETLSSNQLLGMLTISVGLLVIDGRILSLRRMTN